MALNAKFCMAKLIASVWIDPIARGDGNVFFFVAHFTQLCVILMIMLMQKGNWNGYLVSWMTEKSTISCNIVGCLRSLCWLSSKIIATTNHWAKAKAQMYQILLKHATILLYTELVTPPAILKFIYYLSFAKFSQNYSTFSQVF